MNFHEPAIDYAGIAPIIALTVGLCVVLLSGVFKPFKRWAPGLTLLTLAAAAGLLIWQWGESQEPGHRRAAARRPGDLDLADRDPLRRLLRPPLAPRAGRSSKPAAASTTRC